MVSYMRSLNNKLDSLYLKTDAVIEKCCINIVNKYFPTEKEEDSKYAATLLHRIMYGVLLGILASFWTISWITILLLFTH